MKMAKIFLLKKITNQNQSDNILKYKVSIIWNVMHLQLLLLFLLPWGQLCASVLPYLDIISSAFSLSNFQAFLLKIKDSACPKTEYQ